MTEPNRIPEDEAYALYTMLEHVEGLGWYWVHIGRTAKPKLQLSRRIKRAEQDVMLRQGAIYWFVDEIIAKRVHADVCGHLDSVGIKRDGDNRAPKYAVSHGNVHSLIHYHAKQIGTPILSENEIYRARGLRDAKTLNALGGL